LGVLLAPPGSIPDDYAAATWGRWYWPLWNVVVIVSILGPEIYALITNVRNTNSYWVWHVLNVQEPLNPFTWSAAHLLVMLVWLGLGGWLTGHYFFRLWT
jgi:hypothetical protein